MFFPYNIMGGQFIMVDIFWLSIGLLFLTSIISSILRIKNKDNCLKKFNNFRVTANMDTGFTIWGKMKVYSSGVEFFFDKPYDNGNNMVKKSFIFYENEVPNVEIITRYVSGLNDIEERKRIKQVKKLIQNRKRIRKIRFVLNIIRTLKNAIAQTVNIFVKTAGAAVTKQTKLPPVQSKQSEELAKTVASGIEESFEPILENYIYRI